MSSRFLPPTAAAALRGLVFVHLFLSPLVFSGATVEAFETNKAALLAVAALAAVALAATGLRGGVLRQAGRWFVEPTTLAVLAFVASACVSTVVSVDPIKSVYGDPESCSGLITVASYAVLFLATRGAISTRGDVWRLLAVVGLATALSATFGLLQAAKIDPFVWAEASEVAGVVRPFAGQGHANFLGAYLVTALPAVVALAMWAHRRGQRPLAIAFAVVAVATVAANVATLSRGAWLALGATLVVTAFALRRAVPARWWVVPAVCAVVAGLTFHDGVAARLQNFGNAAGRFDLWRAGLAMYQDHPVSGVGLDGYRTSFGQYRPVEFWKVEWNSTPTKAHNEFIHVLATQGTLGGVAALALVAAVALAAWRAWRNAMARPLVAAAALGIGAFGVQVLFSFTVVGCGTLVVVLAAVLARCAEGEMAEDAPSPEWWPAVGVGLSLIGAMFVLHAASQGATEGWKAGVFASAMTLVGCFVAFGIGRSFGGPVGDAPEFAAVSPVWQRARVGVTAACVACGWFAVGKPYSADIICREGDDATADPRDAVPLYQEATELAPRSDLYWSRLAEACRHVQAVGRDADERRRFGELARVAADRAVRLAPAYALRHSQLGQVLADLAFDGIGTPEDAIAAYDAALACDPRNPAILADAARAAWGMNRMPLAREYVRRGLELDPIAAGLLSVQGSVAMAEGNFEEADRCLRDARELDWHGDEEGRLRALATWGACLARINKPIEAESWLRYVLDRRPTWLAARYTLAFSLMLSERHQAKEEFRRVIEQEPNHPLAVEASKWLAKIEK